MAVRNDNMRGALLMMGSMACFTFNDGFLKALAGELPLMQVLFIRTGFVTLALFGYLRISDRLRLGMSAADRWLVFWRMIAEVAAAYFFLTALFNMPLANVSAILQALPLTVTLAGALFLSEAVGWRRLSAILIGFFGVMLIVRPGTDGFTVWSVYGLLAVAAVTVRDLVTRRLSPEVSSMTVALATSVAVTLFAGVGSIFVDWQPVTSAAALKLGGATVCVLFGYLFSIMVMRVGDIGFVAPFRYTSLIVALAVGYLVFDDWPDTLTLMGAAIVVGTGLFTLYRERQAARADLASASASSRPS